MVTTSATPAATRPVRDVYILDFGRGTTARRLLPAEGAGERGVARLGPRIDSMEALLAWLQDREPDPAGTGAVCPGWLIDDVRSAAMEAGARRIVLPCSCAETVLHVSPDAVRVLCALTCAG